ncbi:exopolyphosphatase / guanosine-5'-triphosphate,3'-diphosphate pyrophosphatase [Thermostaphylospora chromogena]|uniref:Exopolyphosphatase / guanosine-5'-triphosphate,3'-diphosphate pyrophosphatase n=2 Tax=Thermostaphylospora chromogena TaxID=35622 RepID=A0A1H1GWN6_9ACTN|nr:exopolyphosphatase / guanosine-5'-triphosphate,3'-diphosphate pyrophosphatase [Thermostaphylospora chromogena]
MSAAEDAAAAMRLGALDIGSTTVHLLVVDVREGARPLPVSSRKDELCLAEHLEDGGRLSEPVVARLRESVGRMLREAEDEGVEDLVAFATSAVREAANGRRVIEELRDGTGVEVRVLSGEEEARLTFLATRRWFGWSAGRLLSLDIGGGSLEISTGVDEEPDVAVSLPLGAGRLTREWFSADPPLAEEVGKLREHVRAEIAPVAGSVARYGRPDRAVATSKTFKLLARIAGAAPPGAGRYVRRTLSRAGLAAVADRLVRCSSAERARLPGVSARRAPQLAAGAIVADVVVDLFELEEVEICPWALREGVVLRRFDAIRSSSGSSGTGCSGIP